MGFCEEWEFQVARLVSQCGLQSRPGFLSGPFRVYSFLRLLEYVSKTLMNVCYVLFKSFKAL